MTKVKIYTKSGDHGETSLFSGDRVLKNDPFIEALGTVDECNSSIGIAISLMDEQSSLKSTRHQLETIQHTLFDLGASLATPRTRVHGAKIDRTRFDADGTELLEKWIDEMEESLPELHTFILPGGHPAGAFLHLARSICRRAERNVIAIAKHGDVSKNVIIYLNRLSDYLFVVSLYANYLYKLPETPWIKHSH